MLFALSLLLSISQLTQTLDFSQGSQVAHISSNLNISNNALLKNLVQQMELLETANENLRLKIDTLNIIITKEFISQTNMFRKDLEDLKRVITSTLHESTTNDQDTNDNCVYSYENLIDIRSNFNADIVADAKPYLTNTSYCHSSTNCNEALRRSGRPNGIHKLQPAGSKLNEFYVFCEPTIAEIEGDIGGGPAWTVIQRRLDGSIDFYRKWSEYQHGFGNLEGEFFIGLDKLHALTQSTLHELWIQMEDFENNSRWAKYSTFAIGDASEGYALNILGNYSGNAGDSFGMHAGLKFTTNDVDNDRHVTNCAVDFTGAWWYGKCHESNLNGQYLRGSYASDKFGKGINWYKWHGHYYSLKYVHMAIRPVRWWQH